MNKSKVNVSDAIAKLKDNRRDHIKEYKKAKKGYRKAVRAALKKHLAIVESKDWDFDRFQIALHMPKPTSWEKDYDRAIEQLQWALDAGEQVVELDSSDFNRFILNDWEWQQQFAGTTTMYNAR